MRHKDHVPDVIIDFAQAQQRRDGGVVAPKPGVWSGLARQYNEIKARLLMAVKDGKYLKVVRLYLKAFHRVDFEGISSPRRDNVFGLLPEDTPVLTAIVTRRLFLRFQFETEHVASRAPVASGPHLTHLVLEKMAADLSQDITTLRKAGLTKWQKGLIARIECGHRLSRLEQVERLLAKEQERAAKAAAPDADRDRD